MSRNLTIVRTGKKPDSVDVDSPADIQRIIGRLVFIEMITGTRIQGRIVDVGPRFLSLDTGKVALEYIMLMSYQDT